VKASPLKIVGFEISTFSLSTEGALNDSNYIPKAEDIKFKVTPYQNKEKENWFKLDFTIQTKRKGAVNFEVAGFAVLEIPKNLDVDEWLTTASIPMIFSTLRGFLFASTLNSPVRIILPLINITESLNEIGYIEEEIPKIKKPEKPNKQNQKSPSKNKIKKSKKK